MGYLGVSRSAICYVCDLGFLVPTLISIESARRFVPSSVPIYLVTIFPDDDHIKALEPLLSRLSVTVIPFDRERIESVADVWAESHVPTAALGRFFLPELLPDSVKRILYVDGDTMFVRDPSPLLDQPLPAGKIGMVEDALSFYRHDQSANGADARAYMQGIGLSPDARYANSGVFVVERDDWKVIATEALAYLSEHSKACLYHDQSALNAVLGDRSFPLSPIWNYQSRFVQWRAKPIAKPAILHFTGAAKPWMGEVRPWKKVSHRVRSILASLPTKGLPLRSMSDHEVAAHNSQYEGPVRLVRKFLDTRQLRRVRSLRRYHRSAVL
ncbi:MULTISPECIES: glycosyltransferase [unclassified Sphingomonas]|uniref:glycosyltransferase family 8 protein n=1 Tax=unclassified Sphingomonas TaxID=196159 RepID=UPI002269BA38|nr:MULTISPECIES: glycosyltransferase [unclassified Sphingomonas]